MSNNIINMSPKIQHITNFQNFQQYVTVLLKAEICGKYILMMLYGVWRYEHSFECSQYLPRVRKK